MPLTFSRTIIVIIAVITNSLLYHEKVHLKTSKGVKFVFSVKTSNGYLFFLDFTNFQTFFRKN